LLHEYLILTAEKLTNMKWEGRKQSANVEDRRSSGGGRSRGKTIGGLGCGGVIIAIILALVLGVDPSSMMSGGGETYQQPTQQRQAADPNSLEEQLAVFCKVVLQDNEDVWGKLFPAQLGRNYNPPVLVLFTERTMSGCGPASAATGPFYCPRDQKLYVDLSFYTELHNKFGASGDFAMAYVISHEVGHHVQHLLGITDEVQGRRSQLSQTDFNALMVRLELQADFLAGVWAHHAHKTKNILEEGDVAEAMNAAAAIGDDRIQRRMQGYVNPHTFTHGTSEQRVRWFKKGLQSGDLREGDTFGASYL